MVFLYPRPTPDELQDVYRADYHLALGVGGDDEESLRRMKQETFARCLGRISRLVSPGRVLDVGCAAGYFLEVAAAAGWEVRGVELSGFAAEQAQRRFGDRVITGELEAVGFADSEFDAVTLFDLLEHVPEPKVFLEEVRRVLRPGGVLLAVLPDVESFSARVMGRYWNHYSVEHLHYFSPATVTRLLSGNGFGVVTLDPARKSLNLAYILGQIMRQSHGPAASICRALDRLLPSGIRRLNFTAPCGQMMVIAVNRKAAVEGSVHDPA